MAVVANKNDNAVTRLTPQSKDLKIVPTDVKSAVSAFAQPFNESDKKGYTMSSTIGEITVNDGVDETTCQKGSSAAQNKFARDLERVVSKAVVVYNTEKTKRVTLGTSGLQMIPVGTDPENPIGHIFTTANNGHNDVDNKYCALAFSVEHSAVPVYLYANNAGERTLSEDSGYNIYKGFKSAIHGWQQYPTWEAYEKNENNEQNSIVRLGALVNAKKQKVRSIQNLRPRPMVPAGSDTGTEDPFELLGDFKAKAVSASDASTSNTQYYNGIDFLENSCENLDMSKAYYRTAFAKVYATFVPTQNNLYEGVDKDGNVVTEEEKIVNVQQIENSAYGKKYTIDNNFTIYFGLTTRLFYTSKEAAMADGNTFEKPAMGGMGKPTIEFYGYEYKNGRCGYRVALNRQRSGKETKYCDTRRNNIYKISIDGFKKIGMPWDPIDPNDPYLPKTDGERPEDNPGIDKTDTYMAVTATVLEWNLVERGEILE